MTRVTILVCISLSAPKGSYETMASSEYLMVVVYPSVHDVHVDSFPSVP